MCEIIVHTMHFPRIQYEFSIRTHINYQIPIFYIGTADHGIGEVGFDRDYIPEAKKVTLLGEIVNIDLSPDDDFGGDNTDAYLDVEIVHLGFDVRVVFAHGSPNLSA